MADGPSAVIGVDLGGTKCHAVLVRADGAVLREVYRPTREMPDPADLLIDTIARLRRTATGAGHEVGAVGIGIPAFVDPASGLVSGGWNLGWHGFDLCTRLDDELPEPYVVENDVNLAALGEARVGAGREATSFVVVSLGTGLGGAVVVGGRLLRGSHGAAGEFGFLLTGRQDLRRPGLMPMEARVGGPAIAARARRLLDDGAPGAGLASTDASTVFAAAARGEPVAVQLVDELVEHVAMTIVDLTAVLDPQRVILDGSVGRALRPHLAQVAELVALSVLYAPDLMVSELEPSAALAGAVAEARRVAGDGGSSLSTGEPPASRASGPSRTG